MVGTNRQIVFAICTLSVLGLTLAQQLTYDDRCQILEGGGVRVDQCDAKKLLVCKEGRCQCADSVNHVYTYREVTVQSRSRRSPGKKGGGGSKFKSVAAGAVAGVATYQVAKGVSKLSNAGTTQRPTQKVYGCYSRVGGQCALNYNWENVDFTTTSTTTTSSTTSAPVTTTEGTNTTAAADNSTSTSTTTSTPAPTAAAQTRADISKVPKCIQYAECKTNSHNGNGTSSYLQKVDFDPRLGICECVDGYKKNSKDICVKAGAPKTAGITYAVIVTALLFSKTIAF